MESENARHIAAMTAKLDHIGQVLDELRPLPTVLAAIQQDQKHLAEWQRQVNAMSESRGIMMHALDKRLTVVERWHKFMLTMPAIILTVLIAIGGYVRGYVQAAGQFEDDILQRMTKIEAMVQHNPVTAPMRTDKLEGK